MYSVGMYLAPCWRGRHLRRAGTGPRRGRRRPAAWPWRRRCRATPPGTARAAAPRSRPARAAAAGASTPSTAAAHRTLYLLICLASTKKTNPSWATTRAQTMEASENLNNYFFTSLLQRLESRLPMPAKKNEKNYLDIYRSLAFSPQLWNKIFHFNKSWHKGVLSYDVVPA